MSGLGICCRGGLRSVAIGRWSLSVAIDCRIRWGNVRELFKISYNKKFFFFNLNLIEGIVGGSRWNMPVNCVTAAMLLASDEYYCQSFVVHIINYIAAHKGVRLVWVCMKEYYYVMNNNVNEHFY